ncbi:MAG: hypothetical protein IJZ74_09075 [Clostridia bacterium]|nr:hypothetical protein [Clostridia bacterium]
MFPAQTQQSAGAAKYGYYYDHDSYYNLYAEWTLSPGALAAETARVEALLSAEDTYQRLQHGDYQCLIVAAQGHRFTPFELDERRSNHCLTMFAYNEATGVVRYISCEEYGSISDPPRYMTLLW